LLNEKNGSSAGRGTACLLRSPGYLDKLRNALPVVMSHVFEYRLARHGDADELAAAHLYNVSMLMAVGIDPKSADAVMLLNIFNTRWSNRRAGHVCIGRKCPCGCFGIYASRKCCEKASSLLLACVCAQLPPKPIWSRWTRCISAYEWFALFCNIHYLFPLDPWLILNKHPQGSFRCLSFK
jgi:hypothetical protein